MRMTTRLLLRYRSLRVPDIQTDDSMRPRTLPETGLPCVLLFLHGMNSSPASHKAVMLRQYMQRHHPDIRYLVPVQAHLPQENVHNLYELMQPFVSTHALAVAGSSLGGFYAGALKEKLLAGYPGANIRAVLINPVVHPSKLLSRSRLFEKEQTCHSTGQRYKVTREHANQIKALEPQTVSQPEKTLVLLQTGDERLDYQKAAGYYRDCRVHITPGGCHAYENFEAVLPQVFHFLLDK